MMARHTHIVSLGLFHKTFHSSLLQEIFCFLMYDVLLSIYKINLIKKINIMRYMSWQPLFDHTSLRAAVRGSPHFVFTRGTRIAYFRREKHVFIYPKGDTRSIVYKRQESDKVLFDPFGRPEDGSKAVSST